MPGIDDLFERIARGETPAHRVYQDDRVCAFLDINPLSRGHLLVIPNRKTERVDAMPEEDAAALGRVLPRLARAVMAATGAEAYNILSNTGSMAGQAVPHVHFHIIPKYGEDTGGAAAGAGLPHHWPAQPIDAEGAKALAEKIADAVE